MNSNGNTDGNLHLDVVDDARLKIDTDSSWDIIAMVTLFRRSPSTSATHHNPVTRVSDGNPVQKIISHPSYMSELIDCYGH